MLIRGLKMRRRKIITRPDWKTPENTDETINKGKCWKFNKNVSDDDKKKYRAKSHKEKVSLIIN